MTALCRDQRWLRAFALSVGRMASRIGSIPVRSVATIGRGILLAGSMLRWTVVDAISLRLGFGEIIRQAWVLQKVTVLPALFMAIPFGALVSTQVSGLVNQVGASSLVGAASGVGVIRQGAPITAGLLMGGAAASAIASDFGARAIREELDAMRVLGVNIVRYLIVPRFLALLLIAPMLCTFIIAAAVLASYILAVVVVGVTPGGFWMSFGMFATPVDIWFAIGKTVIFAALVAIISSLRGIEAKGGPRGVADAVNASVVLSVVCIAIANVAVTQLQTMFVPMEIS